MHYHRRLLHNFLWGSSGGETSPIHPYCDCRNLYDKIGIGVPSPSSSSTQGRHPKGPARCASFREELNENNTPTKKKFLNAGKLLWILDGARIHSAFHDMSLGLKMRLWTSRQRACTWLTLLRSAPIVLERQGHSSHISHALPSRRSCLFYEKPSTCSSLWHIASQRLFATSSPRSLSIYSKKASSQQPERRIQMSYLGYPG